MIKNSDLINLVNKCSLIMDENESPSTSFNEIELVEPGEIEQVDNDERGGGESSDSEDEHESISSLSDNSSPTDSVPTSPSSSSSSHSASPQLLNGKNGGGERKRKERAESWSSQETDSKLIRADEQNNEPLKDGHELSDPHHHAKAANSECRERKQGTVVSPSLSQLYKNGEDGDIEESSSHFSYSHRAMPINYEPEAQRQWERTAAQWNSRKLRKKHRGTKRSSSKINPSEDKVKVASHHEEYQEIPSSAPNMFEGFSEFEEEEEENEMESIERSEDGKVNLAPLPLLDLSTLHHQIESDVPLSHRNSHSQNDGALLSPRTSIRIYDECLDSVPPSPPILQLPLHPPLSRQILEGNQETRLHSLYRLISTLKKQLRVLEEEHVSQVGYRLSQADRLNNPEIRKCLLGINRAKREIKSIREDPSTLTKSSRSPSVSTSSKKLFSTTLNEIHRNLEEASSDSSTNLLLMSQSEILNEKLSLQSQLLLLERRHGKLYHFSSEEKTLVAPLYERYRSLRTMALSQKQWGSGGEIGGSGGLDLQLVPILEHETLELSRSVRGGEGEEDERRSSTTTTPDTLSVVEVKRGNSSPKSYYKNEDYNDMDLNELERHYKIASEEKREARKKLREFESNFLSSTGRLPLKEDKTSSIEIEMVYHKYKHFRATLRLLDVLINKRKYPYLLKRKQEVRS